MIATGVKREWAPAYTGFVAAPDGAETVYALYNAGHVWPYAGNERIARFFKSQRLTETGCPAPEPSPVPGTEARQSKRSAITEPVCVW